METTAKRGLRLHELFERQARATPEAVAVAFGGANLTYRGLDGRANQLAHHLRSLGVGQETLVGIAAERSLELVVGLLGILKAGGAYVPLDPDYPADRLGFMMADIMAPVLVTQERLRPHLSAGGARVVCLDADWGQVARERTEKPQELTGERNLAYVIYTSGSTGRPKGAMNEHRGICNRLLWMQEAYRLTPSDTVLQKTPFGFDVSVWEFFWPLMTGARMVLAKPGGHKDAGYLAGLIEQEEVSVLHFVPSMLGLFLEEPDLWTRCRSVRDVICSGEALSYDLQQRFFDQIDARLHNLYGPTEAAVDVTHWQCRRGAEERVVPIGYPVANTQIHILGPGLERVPVGTDGELFIGGVQVGRGYWNRSELTAERFIPDPFDGSEGSRLYRTGDLARQRPDGAFEFLGRTDHQVKIRGNRIELGEIEAVLEENRSVRQAVVVARGDDSGETRLVAYVVPTAGARPTVPAMRQGLAMRLPDYMIPAVYVLLDSMPLSPNGKVDRKALPEPSRDRPELGNAYEAPRGALETLLTRLWQNSLGLDRVGVDDRFFELGGTSLQAARFVNQIQKRLGEFVYVVTIFESPTVAEYAAFLRRDYPAAVAKMLGEPAPKAAPSAAPRITRQDIAEIEHAIPVRPQADPTLDQDVPRNRRALFVLSPPRSGSTLLRVMLGGHPGLFAAAELQLLGFNTLEERAEAYAGKFSLWLEGTIRAVMELRSCDAHEARRIMQGFERRGYSTRGFYGELQEWLGDRMLVDKSPSYATDPRALEKAEADFEEPLYIHLSRHPYAMVRSFERYHMDQVLFLREHRFSPRQLGELIWTVSHRNTLEFLNHVPKDRKFHLRFEDVVTKPQATLEAMCATLGLDYHPDLLEPYKDLDKKMTDGIFQDSTPMGDTHLLERSRIDPKMADAWVGVREDDFLGDVTWDVAAQLGYEGRGVERAVSDRGLRQGLAARRDRLRKERSLRRQVGGSDDEVEVQDP